MSMSKEEFAARYREMYGVDPTDDRLEFMPLWGSGDYPETADEKHRRLAKQESEQGLSPGDLHPDFDRKCIVCGATPVLPVTSMCGPCTTGEAGTIGGNW